MRLRVRVATLYTYLFEKEMMVNSENKSGLKGQHNLAQGNALGIGANKKIVRAITFIKEKSLFRTKGMISIFRQIMPLQFRPKGIICFVHRILADGFSSASLTQGGVSDRSSRNYALGWHILALQAGMYSIIDLCIKSSESREGQNPLADDGVSLGKG